MATAFLLAALVAALHFCYKTSRPVLVKTIELYTVEFLIKQLLSKVPSDKSDFINHRTIHFHQISLFYSGLCCIALKMEGNQIQSLRFERDAAAAITAPKKTLAQSDSAVLLVGSLVWGKLNGYPWWPGKIINNILRSN